MSRERFKYAMSEVIFTGQGMQALYEEALIARNKAYKKAMKALRDLSEAHRNLFEVFSNEDICPFRHILSLDDIIKHENKVIKAQAELSE